MRRRRIVPSRWRYVGENRLFVRLYGAISSMGEGQEDARIEKEIAVVRLALYRRGDSALYQGIRMGEF